MGWIWKENQRGCYELDRINGLNMERKSERLLRTGWNKWVENRKKIREAVYFLNKTNGLEMQRKSERLVLPRWNKWVEKGKKIREAVTI